MEIVFSCQTCSKSLTAPGTAAGTGIVCAECGKAVTVPRELLPPGTRIGEFTIKGTLGKGGMGDVYLAEQASLGRPVALKVMSAEFSENEVAVSRFRKETRLLGKLSHPNIVSAFGAGEDEGFHYLAMAYIDGQTATSRLRSERLLCEQEVLMIGLRLVNALAYAWDNFQLLHRDIKPENIMLTPEGQVLLMDLGISKSADESTQHELTSTGDAVGTPYYMSPELFRGEKALDQRCDIFSLGATLYHLLTGRRPFKGDSIVAIYEAACNETPVPANARVPVVTEGTSELLAEMMRPERQDRPRDWVSLERRIASALKDLPEESGAFPIHQDLDAPTIRIPRLADEKKPRRVGARTITLLASLLAAMIAFIVTRDAGAPVPEVIAPVSIPASEPDPEPPKRAVAEDDAGSFFAEIDTMDMSKALAGELFVRSPEFKPIILNGPELDRPIVAGVWRGPEGSGRVVLLAHSNMVSKPEVMRPALDWLGVEPGATVWSNDPRRAERLQAFIRQRNLVRTLRKPLHEQDFAAGQVVVISPFDRGRSLMVDADIAHLESAVREGTHLIIWCIGWVQRDKLDAHPVSRVAALFGAGFGPEPVTLKSPLAVFNEQGGRVTELPIITSRD